MMETSKKHWLYLEPYCYLNSDERSGVIHNLLDKSIKIFDISPDVACLMTSLRDYNNGYCIQIDEKMLSKNSVVAFICDLRELFCGDILDCENHREKPFVFYPKLKILKDKSDKIHIGENILYKLKELYLFINGSCEFNCIDCDKIHKQTFHCTKASGILNIKDIQRVITTLEESNLKKIHITGGDIFSHPDLDNFIDMLNGINCEKVYYVHYKNFMKFKDEINTILRGNVSIRVLVNFPIDETIFNNLIGDNITIKRFDAKIIFMISSYDNFIDYNKLNLGINSNIVPYYNGFNYDFFENYVFIRKEDLNGTHLSRNDFFAKSCVNLNYWGKLIVQANSKVLLSNNTPPIGNIHQPLKDLLINVFDDESPWFKLRDFGVCEKCAFNLICPQISEYEHYMNKWDLCLIRN